MLILMEKGWELEPEGRVRFPWEREALEPRPQQGQRPGLPGRHCCGAGTGAGRWCRGLKAGQGGQGGSPGRCFVRSEGGLSPRWGWGEVEFEAQIQENINLCR